MAATLDSSEPSEANPSQRFFQYFQLEATALQQQITRLEELPAIGGERIDAIDHCLAGIARLQRETQDAASYTTSYDQRVYSQGIKALRDNLDTVRATLAPKSKFSFKSSVKKNESAISLTDAAELAMQQRAGLFAPRSGQPSSEASPVARTPAEAVSPPIESASRSKEPLRKDSLGKFLQAAGVEASPAQLNIQSSSAARGTSSASSNAMTIDSQTSIRMTLPSTATESSSSASLTNLDHCVVDLSIATTTGRPLAALTVKDVKQSLLICGNVDGAAHITNIECSVIVVTTRQFRMHHCTNCIVYLHVNSRPIIEKCNGIKFAPLPEELLRLKGNLSPTNEWDQVQDFNWLKSEPSPNWKPLSDEDKVLGQTWLEILEDEPAWPLERTFKATGLEKLSSTGSA